jgi:hypothetical protein
MCGSVRFEVSEPPLYAGYCHCTRCQRRTGTAASVSARVAPGSLHVTRGAELVKAYEPPDGFHKLFCSECGSALWSQHPEDVNVLSVRLGAFDDDPGVRRARALPGAPAPALTSHPAPTPQLRQIQDGDASARERDRAPALLLAEDAVDGRARRPRHRGDVFLCQRNHCLSVPGAIGLRELQQAASHTRVCVDVVRFDEPVARAPKLVREQAKENVLHPRVLALEPQEIVAEDGPRFPVLERGDRGRAPGTRLQHGQLAEGAAGPHHVEEHLVAERRHHASAEAAANDEMERVGRVLSVEDDFAASKRPSARDREQLADVVG